MNIKTSMLKNNRLNIIMTIISNVLFVFLTIFLGFMIKTFTEAIEFHNQALLDRGKIIAIVYIVLFVFASKLRKTFFTRYIQKASIQLKDYIFEKILNKSISEFDDGQGGDIISSLSNDINVIEMSYLTGAEEIVYNLFILLIASAALIYMDTYYGLRVVIVAFALLLLSLRRKGKLAKEEKETSDSNRLFINQVKDILNGFVEIKSFNAETRLLENFKKQNMRLETVKREKRETQQEIDLSANIYSMILNLVVVGLGVIYAFNGQLSLGTVIASIQLANFLMLPIRSLGLKISNFSAASKLLDALEESLMKNQKQTDTHKETLEAFQAAIRLENVSFNYGNNEILKDINFCFEKNKKYTIVGLSGSGKSTLLKLILGYLTYDQGQIFYDQHELKNLSLENLYQQVSVLQQEVFLFDASLEENISMYNHYDQDLLNDVIHKAGLSDLVEEKGLDYQVGERGDNLSGGEKQRVSIARVLIRNSPIIFMDEATSSLDNKTAREVEKSILAIENTTLISITHRYVSDVLRKYDKIIVMNDGKIEEIGDFDSLMAKKGYFYSLNMLA